MTSRMSWSSRSRRSGTRSILPRQESFASLHILTRRASEGSEALPSLSRRVRMSFFGAGVISSGFSSGMTLSAHFVNRVPFSLSFVLSHRLLASLLTVLPNSLDFLVSPQCRLPVRPRERRHHVSGVPHLEAGAGDLLLISPRDVRDIAILDAN